MPPGKCQPIFVCLAAGSNAADAFRIPTAHELSAGLVWRSCELFCLLFLASPAWREATDLRTWFGNKMMRQDAGVASCFDVFGVWLAGITRIGTACRHLKNLGTSAAMPLSVLSTRLLLFMLLFMLFCSIFRLSFYLQTISDCGTALPPPFYNRLLAISLWRDAGT